ncbi:Hypothetical predicted protein, partial [Pelobates cultripes]
SGKLRLCTSATCLLHVYPLASLDAQSPSLLSIVAAILNGPFTYFSRCFFSWLRNTQRYSARSSDLR